MSYHNVEQGVRCERLKGAEIDAKLKILSNRKWPKTVVAVLCNVSAKLNCKAK